jgi:hypothetical protein
MEQRSSPWVAKVHPLDRLAAGTDPLELRAEPVPGDPDVMLQCILQEFAWMGWDISQLLSLFHHPGYPVLGQLRQLFGDDELRRRVETLAAQWGVLRFHETQVADDDEPETAGETEEVAPRLFQITWPSAASRPGSCRGVIPIDMGQQADET